MTKRYRQAADYAAELREEAVYTEVKPKKNGCCWTPLAVCLLCLTMIVAKICFYLMP